MIKLKMLLKENHEIVDLRDPNWNPTDKYSQKDKDRTMINISGNKIFLYHWGIKGNKIEWNDVISQVGKLNSMILLTKTGNLVLPDTVGEGNSKWEGKRNIFTPNTKEWVDILLNNHIISPNARIYIGNWAGQTGTFIGSAKVIVEKDISKIPKKLVFYHGTSSDRLEQIKIEGLKPVPLEFRPWKSDVLKHHPEFREHSVYLTYDKSQAYYYAKKAVNVARRHQVPNAKMLVLKITISSSHYKKLLPDDDYLIRQLMQLGVTWLDSLKNFSQVAYFGSIPPEWIEVYKIEKHGYYEPTKVKEFKDPQIVKPMNRTTLRNYASEIAMLEKEWERLDSMGGQETRQEQIRDEMLRLRQEQIKWEKLYKTTLDELEYPLATGKDLHSYEGAEGWKGKLVWMSPEKFLRLCSPLPDYAMSEKSYWNLRDRMKKGLPVDFLVLEIDVNKRKVIGHEGRHRATVSKELGIAKVPVLIYTGHGYTRVPKWSPADHEMADKAEFKPEWEK